jgi:hypothetical protein
MGEQTMNSRAILMALAAICLGGLFALCVVAAERKPESGRSLDDRLLEELNARSTNDVDRELFGPERKPAAKQPPVQDEPSKPGKPEEDLSKRLAKELGNEAISEDQSPLLRIARDMQTVGGLLGETECGPPTQHMQKKIVADMDELLKQIKKQCGGGQCKPSEKKSAAKKPGESKGSKSRSKEGAKTAPKSQADAPLPKPGGQEGVDRGELVGKVWGELPEAQRKQMMSPTGERFLPKYETQIEQYYRRLLEQKPHQP